MMVLSFSDGDESSRADYEQWALFSKAPMIESVINVGAAKQSGKCTDHETSLFETRSNSGLGVPCRVYGHLFIQQPML